MAQKSTGKRKNRSRKGEEAFILAMAQGLTVKDAALVAGIARSTAQRRLNEPRTQERIYRARAILYERVEGELVAHASAAVETLAELLNTRKDTVRLGAARALLGLTPQWRESGVLAKEVDELREKLGLNEDGL